MNRRDSVKALAIGSVSVTTSLFSWARNSEHTIADDNYIKHKKGVQDEMGRRSVQQGQPPVVLQVIADNAMIRQLAALLPPTIEMIPYDKVDSQVLLKELSAGGGMVWIGSPEGIPKELSVGAFRPSEAPLGIAATDNSPVPLEGLSFRRSSIYAAYIAPPKEMPVHNIDEEVRADFLPLLKACDRFGRVIGYPAVLMSYYAPSLAGGRFEGSECFFFFFDKPLEALDIQSWVLLLSALAKRRQTGLQITTYDTNYASYRPGERVQIRTRLNNRRPNAVSATLRYSVKAPGASDFKPLAETRRVPAGKSNTESVCDFRPPALPGLWVIRLEVLQDVERAELLALVGEPVIVDRRDLGFMMIPEPLKTPAHFTIQGPGIVLDGKEGFWAGTHYYPSSSWWEWAWRDFHPLKAAEDFAAIRRTGYRIVRVWIDPVLDELILRAMDAAIWLAAENGIVLDICIFTQWVRKIGFERPSGEHVLFDYRDPRDFNIVSFSLRNLNLQREYVTTFAHRWKAAKNIIYDMANEVYVKDPDPSQMDPEATAWKEASEKAGTVRDTLLFRRWAHEMTQAIRKAGGMQPVMPGYMFSTMNGGDIYLANADGPMVPWHSYLPPEQTALTVQYFDPIASQRPLILEEFGTGGWNSTKHYDADVHYALAAGASGAMSYEWGVSWLARESCFWPLPLREAKVEHPDPRWFPPYIKPDKSWNERGVGLCPTPSGLGYGSIYHGTPFPAPAAIALARLGLMGGGLQRVISRETVYVVVPASKLDALEPVEDTLKALWAAKIIFGIWQERSLHMLPRTTKALICPFPLSETSKPVLDSLRARGVQIHEGANAWRECKRFDRVEMTNGQEVKLLTRRTLNGMLFTMVAKDLVGQVSLKYANSTISVGLDDFGLAHFNDKGVQLLEGSAGFLINNIPVCSVEHGRLILVAEDGLGLMNSRRLKLMVTAPTRIVFQKKIASIALSDGFNRAPQAVNMDSVSGTALYVDDQLIRYVIHVSFK